MYKFITSIFRKFNPPSCAKGEAAHDVIHYATSRHFWDDKGNGETTGMYFPIEESLKSFTADRDGNRALLLHWRSLGFNATHVNLRWWKCSRCGKELGHTEYYVPCLISEIEKAKSKKTMAAVVAMVS